MNRRTVCVNLLASLALITGAQVARAQITSDWPVYNGTPQQTRFANVTFGGPPAGILWRDTNSVDPINARWLQAPVASDGLLTFSSGCSTSCPWTTRIYDAETGQCLYTFPVTDRAVQAIGRIGTQTTLFRAVRVCDVSQRTMFVTLTSYDLSPILARIPGAVPVPQWSSEFTLFCADLFLCAEIPCLNYADGAVYFANCGGIIKIHSRTKRISRDFYSTMGQQIGQTIATIARPTCTHTKLLNHVSSKQAAFLGKTRGNVQVFSVRGRL
jgi:hypothetical protein